MRNLKRSLMCACLALVTWPAAPILGRADDLFDVRMNFDAGPEPWSFSIGDLNGDRFPDLAVANADSGDASTRIDGISVLLGNGDGTFKTPVRYGAGTDPRAVAIADLDGDGASDLVVANTPLFAAAGPREISADRSDVSVLLGNGDGTFRAAMSHAAGSGPCAVAVADLNGDSAADLLVANCYSNDVSILFGDGHGDFGPAQQYSVGDQPVAVAIADLDGDGDADLIVVNANDDTVSVILGDGEGAFGAATSVSVGAAPFGAAVGDLDGDTVPDLAVANSISDTVSVFLGNGDGTFGSAMDYSAGDGSRSVAFDDLDGDDIPDMAVANSQGDTISVLLGNGDGTFGIPVHFGVDNWPRGVCTGDLDDDGDADLVSANFFSATVSVLLNRSIERTIAAELSCTPALGTVPFDASFALLVTNLDSVRPVSRVALRVDVDLGSGAAFSRWRAGFTNVAAGTGFSKAWVTGIPEWQAVIGDNTFTLKAEDVTPSPYNQPPYPPSGSTDSDSCVVAGSAP